MSRILDINERKNSRILFLCIAVTAKFSSVSKFEENVNFHSRNDLKTWSAVHMFLHCTEMTFA
jgi:hypothetical protein